MPGEELIKSTDDRAEAILPLPTNALSNRTNMGCFSKQILLEDQGVVVNNIKKET